MNEPTDNTRYKLIHLRAAKTVLAFWLLGWFLKADFYISYIFQEIIQYPFFTDFFPVFFRDPLVLQFFYCLPLLAFWVIVKPNWFYLNVASAAMVTSSFMLLLHQDTHNDATFLTSFWVGVWFWWFINQLNRAGHEIFIHARSLALCVIAVIFLGGFIGKITEEYWSGEVFADIFMRQNFGWIGQWIRGHFSEDAIRWGFGWIAKIVILGEGILALAPLWPYKLVQILGITLMVSISLFTTWRIFSVLFCLIGLLYVLRYFALDQNRPNEKK